jgi:hemerythrin-like domain-containing protein
MRPTETLMSEHREIEKTLDRVVSLCEAPEFDKAGFQECVSFIRDFADRKHHGKEEDRLFPRMIARGMPKESGPIACMLEEHETGRALVRRAAAGLESGDEAEVKEALGQFVPMLRDHIQKEDQILFRMADQMLTEEDQAALETSFAEFDAAFDKQPV